MKQCLSIFSLSQAHFDTPHLDSKTLAPIWRIKCLFNYKRDKILFKVYMNITDYSHGVSMAPRKLVPFEGGNSRATVPRAQDLPFSHKPETTHTQCTSSSYTVR